MIISIGVQKTGKEARVRHPNISVAKKVRFLCEWHFRCCTTKGHVGLYILDSNKSMDGVVQVLGWQPKISLDEGLQRTIR
jgi:hypothetical protein